MREQKTRSKAALFALGLSGKLEHGCRLEQTPLAQSGRWEMRLIRGVGIVLCFQTQAAVTTMGDAAFALLESREVIPRVEL